jgi:hypothetical protein
MRRSPLVSIYLGINGSRPNSVPPVLFMAKRAVWSLKESSMGADDRRVAGSKTHRGWNDGNMGLPIDPVEE